MEAVLLAGGYGTRLRPLTYTRPKPLLPVAGRPMLEWALDRLPPDVHTVVVAVNWKADELEHYLDNRPAAAGRELDFVVVREDEPLGTAGAVKNCARHLRSPTFFVLNADIVSRMDLGAMVRQHAATGGAGTIAVKEVPRDQVSSFGVVAPAAVGCAEVPDAVRIGGFVEKPKDPATAPSRLVNAGAYLLDRRVVDLIPPGRLVSMEKEIFPQLIPRGFWAWRFEGPWIDVGDPARLLAASRELDSGFVAGEGARIAATARIVDSVLGHHCTVGERASVVRCVVGDRVRIEPGVHLEDCVVGDTMTVRGSARAQMVWDQPVPAGYPEKQVGNSLR